MLCRVKILKSSFFDAFVFSAMRKRVGELVGGVLLTCQIVPQQLLQVDIGSGAEILYNASGYDAHDLSAAPAECGRAVTIKCRDGLAPESKIRMGVNCSDVTFQMTCNGKGYWQGFEKCVPKMCVVNEINNIIIDASIESCGCREHAHPRLSAWL